MLAGASQLHAVLQNMQSTLLKNETSLDGEGYVKNVI